MPKDSTAVQQSSDQQKPERNLKGLKKTTSHATFLSRNQTIINFWLDALLLIGFLVLIWVTVVIRFVFPSAGSSAGYVLWGMKLSEWLDFQFGVLACFAFGILLHLMLHWGWVCGILGSRFLRSRDGGKRKLDDGQRTILGVGLLIVILNVLGLGIAAAVMSIQAPL